MESERRLKLIVAGLVLAAFAVGYFFLAQRFTKPTSQPTPRPSSSAGITILTPAPEANSLPGSGVSSLPNTGFPGVVLLSGASSFAALGWYLRKYPR